jgi:hypothetical protein
VSDILGYGPMSSTVVLWLTCALFVWCTVLFGVWLLTVVLVPRKVCVFIQWVGFVYLLFGDEFVQLAVFLNV